MIQTRLSPCRRYRYTLDRRVSMFGTGAVTFLMLNPSTADENRDDPTIRRCIDFARRWGYSTLYVVNLSPLRATDRKELRLAGPEPPEIWRENLFAIRQCVTASEKLVLAYGTYGAWANRERSVLRMLRGMGVTPHCLKVTKDGHPQHPLYVRASTNPIEFEMGKERA